MSQSNGYSECIYFLAENDTLTLCYKHYGYPNQERIATSTITSTGEVSNITDVCLQADSKTDNMTLAVGRDSYGKLYATMPTLAELGASAKPTITTVTLSASGWNSSTVTQTVTVPGILADETKQLIQVMPAPTSMTTVSDSGAYCSAQGDNSLTFTCTAVPTEDIVFNISFQDANYV